MTDQLLFHCRLHCLGHPTYLAGKARGREKHGPGSSVSPLLFTHGGQDGGHIYMYDYHWAQIALNQRPYIIETMHSYTLPM